MSKNQRYLTIYKFNAKFIATVLIPNLFMTMPHVFVFLSEFSDNHVMGGFLSMMEDLSHTSSNVDFVLQANIVKGMKAQLNTVHCRRHRYLNCMELDSFLMNPQKFEGK